MTKFPEGRQASAVIPLLWRAQEQEGWLSRPALEAVSDILGMAYIRVLEVATFYFMFQLQPVGQVAHFQICGTTTCMICGAEDLISVCQNKISTKSHAISENGMFSWEEVECLGACANAPMVQIGKDYYEDLTAEKFSALIDDLAAGNVPTPGSQSGRYAAEGDATCAECTAGRYQAERRQSICKACDAGKYQPLAGAEAACRECDPGTYQYEAAKSACKACGTCPAGSFAAECGTTSCAECAAGTFQDQSRREPCDDCAVGRYQGEELIEVIRNAEEDMLDGEEGGGSWVGGDWWQEPLVMFGDVEMQTVETREIPGNQTMDFVLKLGVDYPKIVDGSEIVLEVPPHPPPVRFSSRPLSVDSTSYG